MHLHASSCIFMHIMSYVATSWLSHRIGSISLLASGSNMLMEVTVRIELVIWWTPKSDVSAKSESKHPGIVFFALLRLESHVRLSNIAKAACKACWQRWNSRNQDTKFSRYGLSCNKGRDVKSGDRIQAPGSLNSEPVVGLPQWDGFQKLLTTQGSENLLKSAEAHGRDCKSCAEYLPGNSSMCIFPGKTDSLVRTWKAPADTGIAL